MKPPPHSLSLRLIMSLISACNPVIARLDGTSTSAPWTWWRCSRHVRSCKLYMYMQFGGQTWAKQRRVASSRSSRSGREHKLQSTEDNEKPHHINTETLLRFRAAFYSHSNYSTCIVLASEWLLDLDGCVWSVVPITNKGRYIYCAHIQYFYMMYICVMECLEWTWAQSEGLLSQCHKSLWRVRKEDLRAKITLFLIWRGSIQFNPTSTPTF